MGREMDNFEIDCCTKAAHEVVRAFCEAMRDFSHLPWEATPEDLKTVARQATIGIATADHNAEQSHIGWVAIKRAQGWKFGPTKNEKLKEHPCLVEWSKLPFEQQVKDELWVSTVKNLMGAFWRIPS
jgi:hypothetical protein